MARPGSSPEANHQTAEELSEYIRRREAKSDLSKQNRSTFHLFPPFQSIESLFPS